jgi:hypothetical protein
MTLAHVFSTSILEIGEHMKKFWVISFLALFLCQHVYAISNFDFTFNLGPAVAQSGNIEKLGVPNINTGFEIGYFFKPNHGVGISTFSEFSFSGSKEVPSVKDGTITTLDIHYAYRYLMPKVHIIFEPGFGIQTLYDQSNDFMSYTGEYEDLSTSMILNYKLFVRYILKEWETNKGPQNGSFFLGAGIIQIFSTNDHLQGQDIGGSRFSALLQIGFGF